MMLLSIGQQEHGWEVSSGLHSPCARKKSQSALLRVGQLARHLRVEAPKYRVTVPHDRRDAVVR